MAANWCHFFLNTLETKHVTKIRTHITIKGFYRKPTKNIGISISRGYSYLQTSRTLISLVIAPSTRTYFMNSLIYLTFGHYLSLLAEISTERLQKLSVNHDS
jgi:hypothetical protein